MTIMTTVESFKETELVFLTFLCMKSLKILQFNLEIRWTQKFWLCQVYTKPSSFWDTVTLAMYNGTCILSDFHLQFNCIQCKLAAADVPLTSWSYIIHIVFPVYY